MARHTWRHFKALMRKNLINWKRQPVCAFFEIFAPLVLMAVICLIRWKVPSASVDPEGMLDWRLPQIPCCGKDDNGKWSGSTHYVYQVNDRVNDFFNYTGYATHVTPPPFVPTSEEFTILGQLAADSDNNLGGYDPPDYDIAYDWYGPEYFFPPQCVRQTSWAIPKRGSPIIAIVDDADNPNIYSQEIYNYFKALKKMQRNTAAWLIVPSYSPTYYKTKQELFDYVSSEDYLKDFTHMGVCMGIEIKNEKPDEFKVEQFFVDKAFLATSLAYGVPSQGNPTYVPYNNAPDLPSFWKYRNRGYNLLQYITANKILQEQLGDPNASVNMMQQPMPTETSIEDPMQLILPQILPFFLLIAYIPPVYNTVFHLVKEKESRTKETMRMMGMTESAYWLSWFVYYTMINTAISTLSWILLLINVINYSNALYVWMFFWLYGQAVFGQIVFLQSLFSSSKYSGIVSTLIYFGSDFFNFLINGKDKSRTDKVLASILPQVSLGQGAVVFSNYECTGIGINYSTSAIIYGNYSFNTALWMFFFSFFFFSMLGLYLDNTLPMKFGRRKHPCYCFMPRSYSCCKGDRRRKTDPLADRGYERVGVEDDDEFERANVGGNNYEAPTQVCKRQEQYGDYLKIENLQKTFDTGFQAVKGLNVKMYSNQIFALLGHNGAGKSTTISILTGLIERSEGSAKVYDTDIFEEMGDVREFMGVCPQHDVLFDLLTPEEHLSIFYDFKGGDPEKKEDELKKMIKDVGLTIDRRKMSHTLSGGNKRKLSVSIALCGGSKFVLLDEPTSGMDLGARRYLWDMLMKYKKGRIVILTTHYMDEADVLGDRIGIMAKGQLMCLGSSLFLKNRFGAGYRLTLVKQGQEAGKGLEQFLHVYFSGIMKHSETRKEINFVIPRDQTAGFKPFFEAFDTRLDEFKLKSYGVSMATLEEVFLKINQEFAPELFGGNGSDNASEDPKNSSYQDNSAVKGIGNTIDNSGYSAQGLKESSATQEDDGEHLVRGSGMCATLGANTTKRFIMYKRDWCGIICEVIVPILMVVIGLQFATQASKLTANPPRFLSSALLPNPQRIMMNSKPVISNEDDLDLHKLAANFPNATSGAFETHWYDDATTYLDFYNRVYEQRNDKPLYPYRYGSYQIYQANTKNNTYHISNFVNITSQDVEALFPQYMYQALLSTVTNKPDLVFQTTTSPFPVFYAFKQREEAAQSFDFAFMVSIGLALIPCVMVSYILQERELHLKHMQLISGMSLFGYWAANILADLVKSFIPIIVILIMAKLSGVWYEGMLILFMLYPIAVVPFSYVTSFIFSSDTVAQICTLFLHFIAGGIMSLTVYTLELIPETQHVGDILRWVFCCIPSFCVTHGIVFSASGSMLVKARESQADGTGMAIPEDLWAWFNLKGDVVALCLHFVIGVIIIFLIECDLFACLGKITFREIPPENEDLELDDDVVAEMERVARQDAHYLPPSADTQRESLMGQDRNSTKQDVIRVNGFRKAYTYLCGNPVLAVEKVSFGLDYGECFALLGVNGAGKSTTFKTLTRDTIPTTGQITIAGYDVQKDFQEARKLIGYCPQHDALFPILTVSEHLWFYAKIKGVPANKRYNMIEKSIEALNLKDHRNKLSQTLSGGNKRKLSVAIAMLGNPPIVLLDEPSAGMDPEARRFMWSVVEKISQRDKRSAVIITSHSMEEAEALSTKMGIMVRGGIFRCFGPSQHVKNKYGIGYEIEVKIQKPALDLLQNLSEDLGFGKNLQQKFNLNRAVAQCREKTQIDPLILDGISGHGLGSDLVVEADLDENGEVKIMHFVTFIYIQTNGFKFIECLAGLFDQVEILEQCSDFYKFRVPKEQRTIGFVFGTIEDKKGEFSISEYSVSQTSLEQIFQNFANQSTASDKGLFTFKINGLGALVCMNPDGRSTITQTRLAQKGLKSKQEV